MKSCRSTVRRNGSRLVRNAGSRAAQSRKTSSRLAPQQQPIDFGDVMLTRGYSGTRAYCQSKLAQIMFTVDLGAALEGTGVTVTCLHPATYMDTSMVRRAGVRPLSTVEEGARAILNLATSPAVEGQTGLYFNGLHQAKAQAQAYDRDARRQLQALSLELTGLSAQGVAARSDSTVARRIYGRRASKTNIDGYAPPWRPALAPPSWID
jgi:hypothetical protein